MTTMTIVRVLELPPELQRVLDERSVVQESVPVTQPQGDVEMKIPNGDG